MPGTSPPAASYKVCLGFLPFVLRREAVMHKVSQKLLRILCRGHTWLGTSECGVMCLADGEPPGGLVPMWCIKCFPAGTVPASRRRGASSRDRLAPYRAGRGTNSPRTRRTPAPTGRDGAALRDVPAPSGRLDCHGDRVAGRRFRPPAGHPLTARVACAAPRPGAPGDFATGTLPPPSTTRKAPAFVRLPQEYGRSYGFVHRFCPSPESACAAEAALSASFARTHLSAEARTT